VKASLVFWIFAGADSGPGMPKHPRPYNTLLTFVNTIAIDFAAAKWQK
jgi:hypothetical protein